MCNNYLRQHANSIIKSAHDSSKLDYCLCCKKKASSFCNSHSLPRFILKNISNEGYVLTSNIYFKSPLMDNMKGLNNSGVFRRICKTCDKDIFKDYESPDKLVQKPTKKILAQIDLKNSLRMYDKRLTEIKIYNEIMKLATDPFTLQASLETQIINNLDLNEIKNEFKRDMDILNKKSTSGFDLIFWKKLNYVTPIAFQGHVALIGDLNGNTINDIYNKSENNVIENINVCVFPLHNETIIMMFVSSENKKYKNFIKQFKQLKIEKQLQLISFIIFNYCEDYFLSNKISDEIKNNEKLDVIAQSNINILAFDEEEVNKTKRIKRKELCKYVNFPNVLSSEYSLSNLQD